MCSSRPSSLELHVILRHSLLVLWGLLCYCFLGRIVYGRSALLLSCRSSYAVKRLQRSDSFPGPSPLFPIFCRPARRLSFAMVRWPSPDSEVPDIDEDGTHYFCPELRRVSCVSFAAKGSRTPCLCTSAAARSFHHPSHHSDHHLSRRGTLPWRMATTPHPPSHWPSVLLWSKISGRRFSCNYGRSRAAVVLFPQSCRHAAPLPHYISLSAARTRIHPLCRTITIRT
ncbi:hypothetical protein B0H14DRAFT_3882181, partial [Mycena olivaceomarginata]